MLKFKCLGSGSSGNCYLLSTETETLILDCGLPIKEIKKGLNFDLSKIQGVIVTHGHHDHDLAVQDFRKMGSPVWQPYLDEIKGQTHKFGSFSVQSFEVPHDNESCVGYFIKVDGQKILYATDFEYIPVSFKKIGLNHLIIECNYQKELVDTEAENRVHVLRGHAELQTTLGIVEDNNSDSLRTVLICHLSNNNSNPEEMVTEVQKVAKNAYVDFARKGLEIELKRDLCPF